MIGRYRMAMRDGRIGHAELAYRENLLMLASSYGEMGFTSPKQLPAVHSQVQVDVEDVDAHFARARGAGATIVVEPEDQPYGDRVYRALDPEGHRWIFSTHVRDVTAEEIQAAYAGE